MTLPFYPRAGPVLMCDFKDFIAPEITKVRPVVVVSPKLPRRDGIIAIVPISLTEPLPLMPYHVRLSKNYHPKEEDDLPCWAICDMVLNIGIHRMSSFKVVRRKYFSPQMAGEDLLNVRQAVAKGLNLDRLLNSN